MSRFGNNAIPAALILIHAFMLEAHGLEPFRIGFSRSLFTTVNDSDAKASIKVWAQTVAGERNIRMDPDAQLFDETPAMIEAMQQGSVDAMSLTYHEYRELSRVVETKDLFITKTSGALQEEYILLVHEASGLTDLAALQHRELMLHHSARTSLALAWLDSLAIRASGGEASRTYFKRINSIEKISGAVLPVFFQKQDAAVVAESGFKTMCELNPQLRRSLKTIAKSHPLIPALMCFRSDYTSPERDRLLSALRELHTTTAGEQVLMIFQSEALVPVDQQLVNGTEKFLAEVSQLRSGRGMTQDGSIADTEDAAHE